MTLERLREELKIGPDQIAAGEVEELNIEEIKAEERKLLAELSSKSGKKVRE